jgi:hypothetical protein
MPATIILPAAFASTTITLLLWICVILVNYFYTGKRKEKSYILGSDSVLAPAQSQRPLPLAAQRRRHLRSTSSAPSQSLLLHKVFWVRLEGVVSV